MVEVYRVKYGFINSFRFEKVQADRTTASSVFIGGNRVAKVSDGTRYFDDFDEAKKFAVHTLTRKCESAEETLRFCSEALDRVRRESNESLVTSTSLY